MPFETWTGEVAHEPALPLRTQAWPPPSKASTSLPVLSTASDMPVIEPAASPRLVVSDPNACAAAPRVTASMPDEGITQAMIPAPAAFSAVVGGVGKGVEEPVVASTPSCLTLPEADLVAAAAS